MPDLPRQLIKLQLIGIPGAILLGLGLACRIGDLSLLNPLLGESWFGNSCIAIGALILVIEAKLVFGVIAEYSKKTKPPE